MTLGALLATAALAAACGGSTTTISEVAGPEAVKCQTTVSTPPTIPHDGSRVTLTVSAARECSWTASTDASWAQVSPTSGQGETAITVAVSANPDARPRSGSLVVNESRLSLTQDAAPCRFQLGSSQARVGSEGGTLSVSVSTSAGCEWRASSDASGFVRVLTDSGTGGGSVDLQVSNNSGGERSATVTIADQRLTVVQEAFQVPGPGPAPAPGPNPGPTPNPTPTPTPNPIPCTITLDSSERSFGAGGGDGTIRVLAPGGCGWTASASDAWINVSGSTGTGNDTVRYRVAANPGTAPRSGAISVAGRTHTVRQEGAPIPPPSGGNDDERQVQLSGRAFLVDGSCPNVSFFLEFRRVFTTGDTKFKGKCTDIGNGTEVSVEGRQQSDGRVRATELRVHKGDD